MKTAVARRIGRLRFVPALVEPVFTILFFQVGIRTWRIGRGVGVVKIRFVNHLVNIIQNRVGMNSFMQNNTIYVQKTVSNQLLTQDHFEGGFNLKL